MMMMMVTMRMMIMMMYLGKTREQEKGIGF